MNPRYEKGLTEVADGVFAYLQPDGGWGWSNAGLVADGRRALLVDTLFDLHLTAEMLASMRSRVPAAHAIDVVVNTHANGDHCYGNQLVGDARIIASRACAEEMAEVPPSLLHSLMIAAPGLGPMGRYIEAIFGPFDFAGIDPVLPGEVFDGERVVTVDSREVHLVEVGPAHTRGDVIVHVPDADVVFTGDILFNGGHPIVWAGPVSNWVAACDRIVAMAPEVVVPGHGPVTTVASVLDLKAYLEHLDREARPRFEAGMTVLDAANDIPMQDFESWGERERLAVNLTALWRDYGGHPATDVASLFGAMATLAGYRD